MYLLRRVGRLPTKLSPPTVTLRAVMSTTSLPSQDEKPIEYAIHVKLVDLLQPSTLTVRNDSWHHRHHAPMREQGGGSGETHFCINVVSEAFVGKSTMQRHRMIYGALAEELQNGLHALSLTTKTQAETENHGSIADTD